MWWVPRARVIYACYQTSSFGCFHRNNSKLTCLKPISFHGITRFVAVHDYSTSTRLQQQKEEKGNEQEKSVPLTQQTTETSKTVADENGQPKIEEEKIAKKLRRRRRYFKILLFFVGTYVVFKIFAYIVLISEGNAFVMNNTAESLMKKLPLNALSRLWGWLYSKEVPAFARPFFYKMYAFLFDANLDEVEKPLKQYASLQEFFSRKLKSSVRKIDPIDEIISPVDGCVMSCGVVHINKDTENVVIEQVKGISYPLHHFLGYGMKDALQALNVATNDITEDEMENNIAAPYSHFLTSEEHEKKLYYCVLYLAPGDYHRYHSPCDWNVLERKHVSGYLFPVMPLFVKTLRGLFALNERVVLHGKWRYGDFHYVLVGATNVGGMVLHFDNTLNTNLKRKKARKPKKANSVKKEETNSETNESEATDKKATEENNTAEVVSGKHLEENGYDKYLEMRRRVYCKSGIPLHKGEDIGYFKMGSTVVMLFEHSEQFEWGIKPGDRVLLGEAVSAQRRNANKQQ